MRRREVIALAISLAVWPAAAFAQGGGKTVIVDVGQQHDVDGGRERTDAR